MFKSLVPATERMKVFSTNSKQTSYGTVPDIHRFFEILVSPLCEKICQGWVLIMHTSQNKKKSPTTKAAEISSLAHANARTGYPQNTHRVPSTPLSEEIFPLESQRQRKQTHLALDADSTISRKSMNSRHAWSTSIARNGRITRKTRANARLPHGEKFHHHAGYH